MAFGPATMTKDPEGVQQATQKDSDHERFSLPATAVRPGHPRSASIQDEDGENTEQGSLT